MVEIIGIRSMTKKKGKIVYIAKPSQGVVGRVTDQLFLFDDLSDRVSESDVGKECVVSYDVGYNGRAVVSGIEVKK